jgi:hypothetical protein
MRTEEGINVELSESPMYMAIVYVLFSVGLGGWLILSGPGFSPKLTGFTAVLMYSIAAALVVWGIALPFLYRRWSKRVARSFSSRGVGLSDETVVPWDKVIQIDDTMGFTVESGSLRPSYSVKPVRRTDIKIDDGRVVNVSEIWLSNYKDVHDYLLELPAASGIYCSKMDV